MRGQLVELIQIFHPLFEGLKVALLRHQLLVVGFDDRVYVLHYVPPQRLYFFPRHCAVADFTDVFLRLPIIYPFGMLLPAGMVVLPAGDILPEVQVLLAEDALPRRLPAPQLVDHRLQLLLLLPEGLHLLAGSPPTAQLAVLLYYLLHARAQLPQQLPLGPSILLFRHLPQRLRCGWRGRDGLGEQRGGAPGTRDDGGVAVFCGVWLGTLLWGEIGAIGQYAHRSNLLI